MHDNLDNEMKICYKETAFKISRRSFDGNQNADQISWKLCGFNQFRRLRRPGTMSEADDTGVSCGRAGARL
jgi:hypothetical protein